MLGRIDTTTAEDAGTDRRQGHPGTGREAIQEESGTANGSVSSALLDIIQESAHGQTRRRTQHWHKASMKVRREQSRREARVQEGNPNAGLQASTNFRGESA